MNADDLKELLAQFKQGRITSETVIRKLRQFPYENLHFARLDHHRRLRVGLPEVVFCQGKSRTQIMSIVAKMRRAGQPVLATRLDDDIARALKKKYRRGQYNPLAKTFMVGKVRQAKRPHARVAVITAGTSDMPVAEEARETLEFLGVAVTAIYDAGVAGLHRLSGEEEQLSQATVLIVVAGMEGALPSVLGGISGKPIIAVPTSVGYGASFGGITPLLAMLNACSSGITVVNIDNGFGAACAAYRIIASLGDTLR